MALQYQSGFGNEFATEAIAGTLPVGQNAPQRVAHGLYAEQLSGTPFTAPRAANRRSWLYRIRPAVVHEPFVPIAAARFGAHDLEATPNQLRWDPFPIPSESADFVDGLITICANGDPAMNSGIAVHVYAANRSMVDRFFYDADGELLIVPQEGALRISTELGILEVAPGEICVIQRGIRFRVELPEGSARGYVCENHGFLLHLPELGPIGSNGSANARDFLTPVAAYEEREGDFQLVSKFLFRDALRAASGACRARLTTTPARLFRVLAGAEEEFRGRWKVRGQRAAGSAQCAVSCSVAPRTAHCPLPSHSRIDVAGLPC